MRADRQCGPEIYKTLIFCLLGSPFQPKPNALGAAGSALGLIFETFHCFIKTIRVIFTFDKPYYITFILGIIALQKLPLGSQPLFIFLPVGNIRIVEEQ